MENINEIKMQLKIQELERTVASLENKIYHVKQALSKNIEILKQHHKSHLEMVEKNQNSEYFKGLASDSKFQIEIAEMNEHHILQILLYF